MRDRARGSGAGHPALPERMPPPSPIPVEQLRGGGVGRTQPCRAGVGADLRGLAMALVAGIRRLDRRITAAAEQISAAVAE